ncbi:hypothetical protein EV363DRAFT_1254274 [Boletus edulis]|uniref:Uncharacterized protein n=1 Tax=Boletus edulis BED1 TaxID=1328754 RepID=A0AAD4GDA4_BOLED|nr:hypothetical protein EV363DRAFT_1254274 [Boletus edulis]KAF8438120.1 hypothetical protein L210DRAFT_3482249 [Boletus edulis BED1]
MTTLDSHDYVHVPPDYPFHPDIEHEESSTRKRLPIPDLRFEQVYLKRIQDCIHIEPVARNVKEKGREQPAEVDTDDSEFATVTHATPLINSSQQVVRVDWGKIAYITLRDQVMMPLLQGMLWGIIGTYYRPFVVYARGSLRGNPVSTRPVEGEGVGWLRSWLKTLGFSSITVGPPSL